MLYRTKLGRTLSGMIAPRLSIAPFPEIVDGPKYPMADPAPQKTGASIPKLPGGPCVPPSPSLCDSTRRGSQKSILSLPSSPSTPQPHQHSQRDPRPPSGLRELYHKAASGPWGPILDLVDEGVGGTYFFKVRTHSGGSKKAGIFKPADEEPGARNNPKGYSKEDENEKGGIKVGDSWRREILAYDLDHDHFAQVPETIEVKLPNHLFETEDAEQGCKVGSLQKYVQNSDGTPCRASCDMGPAAFPTEDVHRIGQFDIRLLNCDRHGGNILVQRDVEGALRLVPIDHSYILPKHAADLDFEWMFWPQSKQPFSAVAAAYIAALQPAKDAAKLKERGIEPEAIELMQAATMALQQGCAHGLSLRTIGRFMRRERLYEPSAFETVVLEARRPLGEPDEGDINLRLLHSLLEGRVGALAESPLLRPLRPPPLTLRERALAMGVTAEPLTPDLEGPYVVKAADGVSIAVFQRAARRRGWTQRRGPDLIRREVAAYRLDDQHWAGVPETVEVRLPSELFPTRAGRTGPYKRGWLQALLPGPHSPLCDQSPGALPPAAVHRLGILDLRLCTARRDCGSVVLLPQGDAAPPRLVPVHHPDALPPTLADMRFLWLAWPPAAVPFEAEEVRYIEQLDPEADGRVLQALEVEPECVELQQAATLVLQAAVGAGFTLRQVGLLFERPALDVPSWVERWVAEAGGPRPGEGGPPLDLGLDLEALRAALPANVAACRPELEDAERALTLAGPGPCCPCVSTARASTARGSAGDPDDDVDSLISFESDPSD